jgi:hypothetical protein
VGSLAWRFQARVRLYAPAEIIADRIPPTAGPLTAIDEHTCLLETGGESLDNLAAFMGALDVDFDVLDPPELRGLLRKLARRYARAAVDSD